MDTSSEKIETTVDGYCVELTVGPDEAMLWRFDSASDLLSGEADGPFVRIGDTLFVGGHLPEETRVVNVALDVGCLIEVRQGNLAWVAVCDAPGAQVVCVDFRDSADRITSNTLRLGPLG
jgi:hypothetical protein